MKDRILLFGEPVTLSHVVRPLVFASRKLHPKWEVHFASSSEVKPLFDPFAKDDRVNSSKWKFHNILSYDPLKFAHRIWHGQPIARFSELKDFVYADLELMKSVKPNVVISDFRLSTAISCRLLGIPLVSISNIYWSTYLRDLSFPVPEMILEKYIGTWLYSKIAKRVIPKVMRKHVDPFNQARRYFGVSKEVKSLREAYCDGDEVLYADPVGLFETTKLPPTHQVIGPLLWEPPLSDGENWGLDGDDWAYVTCGSSGSVEKMKFSIESLLDRGLRVIVSTAGRVDVPNYGERVIVKDYIPAAKILPFCRVAIGHGGSSFSYQALLAGTPVLGLASNMDQFLTMKSFERKGLGKCLRAHSTTKSQISSAIDELINNDIYRNNCMFFKDQGSLAKPVGFWDATIEKAG